MDKWMIVTCDLCERSYNMDMEPHIPDRHDWNGWWHDAGDGDWSIELVDVESDA